MDSLVIGVIQGERILLDGHNRYEICHGEGIRFPTREIHFPNRDTAILWLVENQLGRRNLTAQQRAYYIGKEYLLEKKSHGGDRTSEGARGQNDPLKTAEKIAEKYKTAPKTVKRDAEFAKAVDTLPEEEKTEVLSGESKTTKKDIIKKAREGPYICDRCKRMGLKAPRRGCQSCADGQAARAEKKSTEKKSTKKKPKSGAVKFDWKAFHSEYGALLRQVDKFGNAYGVKEHPMAEGLRRRLAEFHADFKKWTQFVTKQKPPA